MSQRRRTAARSARGRVLARFARWRRRTESEKSDGGKYDYPRRREEWHEGRAGESRERESAMKREAKGETKG